MPSFYETGGVMLTPEAMEMRKGVARGETVDVKKGEMVSEILRLHTELGEAKTNYDQKKYLEMRGDQLEDIHSSLKKRTSKKSTLKVTKSKDD